MFLSKVKLNLKIKLDSTVRKIATGEGKKKAQDKVIWKENEDVPQEKSNEGSVGVNVWGPEAV